MDSPPPSPIDRQLDALRVALTALYGGRPIVEVLVRVEGIARPVRVPFPGEQVQASAPAESPDLSDLPVLAQEIVQVLEENGGWMTGAEIVAKIGGDCDRTSGYWRRITRMLRERGLISSQKQRGYRKRAGARATRGPYEGQSVSS